MPTLVFAKNDSFEYIYVEVICLQEDQQNACPSLLSADVTLKINSLTHSPTFRDLEKTESMILTSNCSL